MAGGTPREVSQSSDVLGLTLALAELVGHFVVADALAEHHHAGIVPSWYS